MARADGPGGWTVRPAGPADDAAIQALFAQTLTQAIWLAPGADIDTDFKRNSGGETVWVCTGPDAREPGQTPGQTPGQAPGQAPGQVLGFIAVYAPGAFIHHLYVAPQAQGQGIGRALLDSLADWLPKPWRLKCVVANTAARAFYARTGWVETERAMGSQGEYVLLRQY